MIIAFDCAFSENDWLMSNVSLEVQLESELVSNFQITEHKKNFFLDASCVFRTSMDVLFCRTT